MDAQRWSLLFAILALGLGIVAALRGRRGESESGARALGLVVGPIAGIIGILPVVIHLSERVRLAAAITSAIVSVGVIALLIVHMIRKRV
jgi:hypothetical protein